MILFISDLHLCARRPETTAAFLRFIDGPARQAKTLWILGDLFEFWVGDDDLGDPFHARIAQALAALSHSGVDIRIIVGNRDFLLGSIFAARCGAHIVTEPALIELNGHRVVLMHGDAQCTDDVAYQRFRRRIRSPLSLALLRRLPLRFRRVLAERIRRNSENSRDYQAGIFFDLNPQVVETLFRTTHADWMIHGHTHRPALHTLNVDGRERQRWVLADWHDQATWLQAGPDGIIALSE
ncbi:UDP-2,3-diacylglucosamine diphosphatase [Uliginosibacterium sp. 31-16]|uniref:UDP-2,3-diacylglucosamine diphosphatase n=1 Tax=Uliginosibacterium sp. 31-16 TaxID=3068315 RepID=UPI00273E5F7C|nr:UDP-2,3-diacylglucosamine diphosphatase [Uliginosibacterium sp. 31-16]MDP5239788.1 UDP-2,3-diacylglucosamine diphosphatase [Uliginosibacterium sp. 31-16]